jgi:hypothetical protein
VAYNYRSAFPPLGSSQPWLARWQALTTPLRALLSTSRQIPAGSAAFSLMEAQPLPVCPGVRPGRVRGLGEDGAYWGKTSQGWFGGFQLHLLRQLEGRRVNVLLTPANGDERAPGWALRDGVEGGSTWGARGYRGQLRAEEWAEEADRLVLTRADAPEPKPLWAQLRPAIETSFSPRWYQFLDRVFARSWPGLWNTVPRKVLYSNLRQTGLLSA